jgi:hypothetical protein
MKVVVAAAIFDAIGVPDLVAALIGSMIIGSMNQIDVIEMGVVLKEAVAPLREMNMTSHHP